MYSEMNNSVGCAAAGTAYRANRHTTTLRGLDLIAIMVGKLLIGLVTIARQKLQPRSNHDRTAKFRTFEFPSRSGVILGGFRSARYSWRFLYDPAPNPIDDHRRARGDRSFCHAARRQVRRA